jgi:DHA2 family multidrug resistance protein
LSFDVFGFATLSVAVGALQLLLDRGQQNDWFSSTETWIEAITLAIMATYFVAHTMMTPAAKSFVDFRLFKNQNFVTGILFIFIVGLVLYATRALIPTMLETLLNYPVATTGLVTAPSGIGTMFAMLIVGRLIDKVDLRLTLFVGFSLTALALWQMAHYSLDLSQGDIIWPGVIQGIGVGLVFVPLSAATFATLSPGMRAQGTALFSLVRNIGSSIGISVVTTLLTRNTQAMHSRLAENITPYFNPWHPAPPTTAVGAQMVNHAVTNQAAMIAYNNDFKLMMIMTMCAAPLVLLLRITKKAAATEPGDAPVVIE